MLVYFSSTIFNNFWSLGARCKHALTHARISLKHLKHNTFTQHSRSIHALHGANARTNRTGRCWLLTKHADSRNSSIWSLAPRHVPIDLSPLGWSMCGSHGICGGYNDNKNRIITILNDFSGTCESSLVRGDPKIK